METPFSAYQGDEPYIFVCYAHDDAALVYPEITRLHEAGFHVWYDEGVSPGSEWSESLAQHIQQCAVFLYFVTPRSVDREHCRQEVNFALDQHCTSLSVHLEPTEVPLALQLSLSHRQAILKYDHTETAYEEKLGQALAAVAGAVTPTTDQSIGDSSLPAKHRLPGWIWLSAGVVIAVLFLVTVWWLAIGELDMNHLPVASEDLNRAPAGRCLVKPVSQEIPTIAILPLEYHSTDRTQYHQGKAIAREIWDRLAKANALRLISMRSSGQFLNSSVDIRDIASQLTADYVIDGTVTTSGYVTEVSIHVIDGESGTSVWVEDYERVLEDTSKIFSLYDELALNIASELEIAIRKDIAPQEDLAAYQPDIAAFYLVQQAKFGLFSFDELFNLLDRAIEIDPNYAQAYATKAFFKAAAAELGIVPTLEGFEEARALALRALELDPDLASAHGTLGAIYDRVDLDFRKALHAYSWSEALCALPDDIVWKQDTLINAGLYEEGLAFTTWWEETDPTSASARIYSSRFLRRMGDIETAATKIEEGLELDRGNPLNLLNVFRFYYDTGDLARAEEIVGRMEVDFWFRDLCQGLLDLARGDQKTLRNHVETWVVNRETNFVSAHVISDAWFNLGEYQQHIDWFAIRVEERGTLGWIKDFLTFQYPDYYVRLNDWALSSPEYTEERLAVIAVHRAMIDDVTKNMVP